jgi:hypothetical protein
MREELGCQLPCTQSFAQREEENGRQKGVKRSFELAMMMSYAKYSAMIGLLDPNPSASSCGIICHDWPGWALGAHARRWHIQVILVKDVFWCHLIARLFPSVRVLPYFDCESWVQSNVEVSLWLSDMDPTRWLRLFESTTVEMIITTWHARHILVKGWVWKVINIAHADCGGGGDQWAVELFCLQARPRV